MDVPSRKRPAFAGMTVVSQRSRRGRGWYPLRLQKGGGVLAGGFVVLDEGCDAVVDLGFVFAAGVG